MATSGDSPVKTTILLGLVAFGGYLVLKHFYPNLSSFFGISMAPNIPTNIPPPVSVKATPLDINTVANTPVALTGAAKNLRDGLVAAWLGSQGKTWAGNETANPLLPISQWDSFLTGYISPGAKTIASMSSSNDSITSDDYVNRRIQSNAGLSAIFNVGPYAERNVGQVGFSLHRGIGLGELLYKYGGRPQGFTTMGAGRATGIERRGINRYMM